MGSVSSAGREEVFFSAVLQTNYSSHPQAGEWSGLASPPIPSWARGPLKGSSHAAPPTPPCPFHPFGAPVPRPASPSPARKSPFPLPPPQVTMLEGGPPVEGLSAPPLHRPLRRCAGCLGVYSCLSAAAGLSRVLGRRSAPGSGSNCGPGVRQPSSRDRGPDRGALELRPARPGAEEHPWVAGAEGRAGTGRRGPTRRCRARPSAAETSAGAANMRSARRCLRAPRD